MMTKRDVRTVLIGITGALVCVTWAGEGPAVRIAAIGDSITQGRAAAPATQSYRYPLWKKLIDAGVKFDMVGSIAGGFEGDPNWPDYKGQSFDKDHEGHWGWPADEIRDKLPGWLSGYTPDIALVLLGSNDLGAGQSVSSTKDDIAQIVDILRVDNPKVIVFVGLPLEEWKEFPALGDALRQLASEKSTKDSPVVAVDHARGWISDPNQPETHTVDWVHPNQAGDMKIAQGWLEAMAPYLGIKIRNKPPAAHIKAGTVSGRAPLTVNFDGAGSSDPDGTVSSFGWQLGDGSNHAGGANVSHTYDKPGAYTVTLGVTDNDGAVGTDTVTITVEAA